MSPLERLPIAIAQMQSAEDVASNVAWIEGALAACAAAGDRVLFLPENATQLAPVPTRLATAEALDGPTISRLRTAAARTGVALVIGSTAERTEDPTHTAATCVVIDALGEIVGTYRKIHLFDVNVAPDTRFEESASIVPGPATPVVVALAGWRIGLSICYDLRFPELYRALVAAGAEVLAVPAAFTQRTGSAHWEVLLRARGIENQCYVVAAAQWGRHYGTRESYGHAMVVGLWGEVLAQSRDGVGVTRTVLERSAIRSAREAIPCLSHRRLSLANSETAK